MTSDGPVLQDRGEQAKALLSAPGLVTAAEALALAVLNGDITLKDNTSQETRD